MKVQEQHTTLMLLSDDEMYSGNMTHTVAFIAELELHSQNNVAAVENL